MSITWALNQAAKRVKGVDATITITYCGSEHEVVFGKGSEYKDWIIVNWKGEITDSIGDGSGILAVRELLKLIKG